MQKKIFAAEVINKYKEGVSVRQLAHDYNLSRAIIYTWLREYKVTLNNKKPQRLIKIDPKELSSDPTISHVLTLTIYLLHKAI